MAKKLYLIDGSGFIFRAYHALPPLSNPQGVPVGAVYGFVNMLMKLLENNSHDCVAVVFDAARHTFRNRIYPEYKAHRPPAPDDLIPQFALIREATDAMNIARIELEDYEADDIIATYATLAQKEGTEVTIVSSDKDLMQLIAPGVQMYDAMKNKVIAEPEVIEKFGVPPEKVLEVLSLIGDSSDNVPGVPGVGPKTAAELISQFGTVEALLERAGEIKQPKRRETILANAENARLSKQLIALKTDVPLPHYDNLCKRELEPEKLYEFLLRMGFKSLVLRLRQKYTLPDTLPIEAYATPKDYSPAKSYNTTPYGTTTASTSPAPAAPEKQYTILRSEAELTDWIDRATAKGFVAFDTETTSPLAMRAELVGFSLCIEPGEACYVPLAHKLRDTRPAQSSMFAPSEDPLPNPLPFAGEGWGGGGAILTKANNLAPDQIPFDAAIALLKPLLEDTSVLKIGHNIKYDLTVMRHYGIRMKSIEDSQLLSYTLHAGEHGQSLDELAATYLGYTTIAYNDVTGTGKNKLSFAEVDIEKAAEYAAEDADITLRLYQLFKPQVIEQKLLSVYDVMERPLISVLGQMEYTGIKIDRAQLASMSADFAARMQEFEREAYQLAGTEFNLGSPKQLGEILFDKLQLPGGKKSTKTGAYTTDSAVLEDLCEQGYALPAKILEWRQLSKLKSTYSDALGNEINPKTGRVHTSYAMALTSTGRLSSSDPNLQNIPIRTQEGKKIRNAFIAESGFNIISADYSQIELRLLAHIADIPTLKEAFRDGKDIHAITASQMFNVPLEGVDGDLRRKAKTINFGIIYGISAHGLASRLGISRGEAATYIGQYFEQYPGIKDYMERAKAEARAHGYVTTLFGRRCHLPGINNKNGAIRQFSERAAINAPLQGTAADIIKRAMIACARKIAPLGDDVRMLLQVHDELVFEIREGAETTAIPLVKQAMESAASLSIPLTVETGIGKHWGEAH